MKSRSKSSPALAMKAALLTPFERKVNTGVVLFAGDKRGLIDGASRSVSNMTRNSYFSQAFCLSLAPAAAAAAAAAPLSPHL